MQAWMQLCMCVLVLASFVCVCAGIILWCWYACVCIERNGNLKVIEKVTLPTDHTD